MATFITVFFGGVISALVTLVLGQPLQHYFWRWQRHAERQLAVIEEVTRITAEVNFLLQAPRELMSDREDLRCRYERLYLALEATAAQVKVLFSGAGIETFQALEEALRAGLYQLGEEWPLEQRRPVVGQLLAYRLATLTFLYREMGIPPRPPWLWFREHVWLPLRARMRVCRSCPPPTRPTSSPSGSRG